MNTQNRQVCDYCGKVRSESGLFFIGACREDHIDWAMHEGTGKMSCDARKCWIRGREEGRQAIDRHIATLPTAHKSCLDRVQAEYESRMDDLRRLWQADCNGNEEGPEDLDGIIRGINSIHDYRLAFDYVAPNTFTDQAEPYWRYQLSWGGPSDGFRFYGTLTDEYTVALYKVEYWFLDWGDGARFCPTGDDLTWLKDFFRSYFAESGTASYVRAKAMEV